jgi:flagellar FliJ protein
MKGLTTLIKLSSRTLDELRRQMVSLEDQKAQLLQLIETMKTNLTAEMQLAGHSPEIGRFYGDFSKRMKQRQEEILVEVKALDKQMEKLRGEISDAFSELKKYEIALENAKKREKETAARKETLMMDDIAAQQYGRKQKDGD